MKKYIPYIVISIIFILILVPVLYFHNIQSKKLKNIIKDRQNTLEMHKYREYELNEKITEQKEIISSYEKLFARPVKGYDFTPDVYGVLTKEGLACDIYSTINYELIDEKIFTLSINNNPDYETKLLHPQVRSIVRNEMEKHNLKDILINKKEEIVQNIKTEIRNVMPEYGFTINKYEITDFVIPSDLRDVFDKKNVQYQWNSDKTQREDINEK